MINEIINKYENFSDSLISEITYKSDTIVSVEVTVKCMNRLNDYKFETIKLFFMDVIFIRFVEKGSTSSTLIYSALLTCQNDVVVFDFFPLLYGEGVLKENEDSDFKIKCKEVNYLKIK